MLDIGTKTSTLGLPLVISLLTEARVLRVRSRNTSAVLHLFEVRLDIALVVLELLIVLAHLVLGVGVHVVIVIVFRQLVVWLIHLFAHHVL